MSNLDGYDLLNDAYAIACTDNPAAREIPYQGAWVPANEITDYEAADAVTRAACDAGEATRGLLEMCLEYLEDDPIWEQLEEAAARALRRFAEEMDEEAARALEEEGEEA